MVSRFRRVGLPASVAVALLTLAGCAIPVPLPPIGPATTQQTLGIGVEHPHGSATAGGPSPSGSWQPVDSDAAVQSMWDTVVANGDQPWMGLMVDGSLTMAIELPPDTTYVGFWITCVTPGASWTASLGEGRYGQARCTEAGPYGSVEIPVEPSDQGVVTATVTVDTPNGVVALVYTTTR